MALERLDSRFVVLPECVLPIDLAVHAFQLHTQRSHTLLKKLEPPFLAIELQTRAQFITRYRERLFELSRVHARGAEKLELPNVKLSLKDEVQMLDVRDGGARAFDPMHLREHDRLSVPVAEAECQSRPGWARAEV